MGLEFKEPAYNLNAKNSRVIRKDMIFNLFLGFSDLTGGTDGKCANARVMRSYGWLTA